MTTLSSPCAATICRDAACTHAVTQAPSGRWFITMGHPQFNSTTNNRRGYATEAHARAAIARTAR